MRIAVLSEGSEIHTMRWVNYFHSCGDEVCLFTLSKPNDEIIANWELIGSSINFNAISYIKTIPSLYRKLNKFNPDIINAHYIPSYGWLAAILGQKPLVLTTWGSDVLINPNKSIFHKWRASYVIKRSNLIICDAMAIDRAIKKIFPTNKTIIIPMGVEKKFFDIGHTTKKKEPIVFQYRNLETIYDVRTLIEALPVFLNKFPAWKIHIAGDGSQKINLENRVRKLGIQDKVIFLGYLNRKQIIEELKNVSIYVSSSLSDGTSVSLLEAMSLRTFPVVSNIPSNNEWINNPDQGLLFSTKNSKSLTKMLIKAASMNQNKLEHSYKINREIINKSAIWEDNMKSIRNNILKNIS